MIDAILEGNSVVVTILAIAVALVLGGLLIAFTDPDVLKAWGSFFSAPGNAIAQAWDAAAGAYVAMFEGAIINPHTVANVFHQASLSTALHDGYISAVFNPLSETAVNATPLILTGLSVGLAFRAGLSTSGGRPMDRRRDRGHLARLRGEPAAGHPRDRLCHRRVRRRGRDRLDRR